MFSLNKAMLLLFNPKAGLQKFPDALFDVVNIFTAAGFLVTVYPTRAAGEVREMVAAHAGQVDYLVCSGGDGTVAEAVNGLIPLNKRPTFAIIPSGTSNDFAASLGLPKGILEAAEIITKGMEKPLDIGQFNDKFFSFVAGFGLFTDVSYATPQNMKNVMGNLAYYYEGIKRLGSIQPYNCTINIDGEEITGEFILGLIANSESVGGIKLPDTDVRMDDGFFEVVLLPRPENLLHVMDAITSFVQQEGNNETLIVRKARRVTVKSQTPIPWTLDGEYGGNFQQVVIKNLHQAIKVIQCALP